MFVSASTTEDRHDRWRCFVTHRHKGCNKGAPVEVVAYSVQNVFLTSPSYEEAMENKKSLGDLASQNNKEPEPEENENEKDVE